MLDEKDLKSFSTKRHLECAWSTRIIATKNVILRSIFNFLSFKRSSIDSLIKRCDVDNIGLDIGAGNGAYCHWMLAKMPCVIVALDWSFDALYNIRPPKNGKLYRICADAKILPFKPETFNFLYSIDTLGHIKNPQKTLDEALRVLTPGGPIFLHSECSDYRSRWPDKMLIKRIKRDFIADLDGHIGLERSVDLHKSLMRRFQISSFFSPAGLFGWLVGYPEKYHKAFKRARRPLLACLTYIFCAIKRMPLLGVSLRLFNAITNHLELFCGIEGGGSCFAQGNKPISKHT